MIKRYDLGRFSGLPMICEADNGEFVKHDDHIKEVESLKEELSFKNHYVSELQAEVERLKELVIWMTGCGYDFTQHDFYNKEMQGLIWSEQVSLPGDSDIEPPGDV
jgi:hypothetical protein